MGTVSSAQWSCATSAETRALGEALGRVLSAGDFVGLIGDLGAGKTELVRGVARGTEVPDEEVSSPTFAIVNTYRGRLSLAHVDLYRIEDARELDAIGFDDLLSEGTTAFLVEWIDKAPRVLPADSLVVTLSQPEMGRERRVVIAEASGPRSAELLSRWQRDQTPKSVNLQR